MPNDIITELESYNRFAHISFAPSTLRKVLTIIGHENCYIDFIIIRRDIQMCIIKVTWAGDSVDKDATYQIPFSVFLSENVEYAAKIWKAELELKNSEIYYDQVQTELKNAIERLFKAKTALNELKNNRLTTVST